MNDSIWGIINSHKIEIKELSRMIHKNPELSGEEIYSSNLLKEILLREGFSVEETKLPTAFKARIGSNKGGPNIAFLAEYDALPEIGHGCGHNLIAAISTYSAIILNKIITNANIYVIGTPMEEQGGGKIQLLEEGVFEDIDFVMMVHPDNKNQILRYSTGVCDVTVEYFGKNAHSSSPENGINALTALINTFNLLNSGWSRFPVKSTISGIITDGGISANVIPDYSKGIFCIRALKTKEIYGIINNIKKIVYTQEQLLGVKGKVTYRTPYASRKPNEVMEKRYKYYLEDLGESVEIFNDDKSGASDIGNVMNAIPAIHPYIKICSENTYEHTKEFTTAACSDYAHEQIIKAIYSLVCVGKDITLDSEFRNEIIFSFEEKLTEEKK